MDQSRESIRAVVLEFINSQEWRDLVTPWVRDEMRRQGILPPEAI